MIKGKVLLIAPTFRNLYKDLIEELKRQGYEVTFVEDFLYQNNLFRHIYEVLGCLFYPYYLRHRYKVYSKHWREIFQRKDINLNFDYIIAVDGHSSCDCLFNKLNQVNPKIKKILYTFDTVSNIYRFDLNYKYYDKIYTFDIDDAVKYNINLLPIWWSTSDFYGEHYNIFGFASFGIGWKRYNVFNGIAIRAKELGLNTLIKLYVSPREESRLVKFLKRVFQLDKSLSVNKDIITHKEIEPENYRGLINSADIILDAIGHKQSGMTTRFSWALGAGKKIITDNVSVSKYPFYDPKQIFIVTDDYRIPAHFFFEKFHMKEEVRSEVEKFRIDNFIKTLLNFDA